MKLFLLFLFTFFPIIGNAQDYWDGESSDKSWYNESQDKLYINSAAQLKGFADLVNEDNIDFTGKTVILNKDINLNSYQWIPIGISFDNKLRGNFDGNNHTISNLYISIKYLKESTLTNNIRYGCVGLFGQSGGTIKNLNLYNAKLFYDANWGIYTSVVAGSCNEIDNVRANSNVIIDSDEGIVYSGNSHTAFVQNCKIMRNCVAEGNIKGTKNVIYSSSADFAGMARSADIIENCKSDVNISIDMENTVAEYGTQRMGSMSGVTLFSKSIKNVIFTGSLKYIDNEKANRWYDGMYGITQYGEKISNAIVVPSEMSGGLSTISYMIADPNVNECDNCFYRNDLNLSDNKGTGMADSYFKTGSAPSVSFKEDWTFTAGSYPIPNSLIQKYYVNVVNDYGAIGYEVNENGQCTLKFDSSNGWKIQGVYINGHDFTESLDGNKLTLSGITENKEIRTVYTNVMNGIDAPSVPNAQTIRINDKGLTFKGFKNGEKALIYTLSGEYVKKYIVNTDNKLELPNGIYIIKVDNKTYKVAF